MNSTLPDADYHAIDTGSPPLITLLWSLRLVIGHWVWGKMET